MKKALSLILIIAIIVCGVIYYNNNKPEVINLTEGGEEQDVRETIDKDELMTNNTKENNTRGEEVTGSSNPIDEYFEIRIKEANNTFEFNQVGEEYVEAWKEELKNIIRIEKERLVFNKDKSYYDDYYASYEKLATVAAEIESLNWVDVNEDIESRFRGTGATFAELLQMKNVYKEGALRLIEAYESRFEGNNVYTYIFSK